MDDCNLQNSKNNKTFHRLFVTVGTTSFDKLIDSITTNPVLKILKEKGLTEITLQIGSGAFIPPTNKDHEGVTIEYYRFKPSIADDIKQADFVISHAGAGSILEVLEAKKPLLTVINEDLMENHQMELASHLQKNGYLFCSTCSIIKDILERSDLETIKPFDPGDPSKFRNYLDKLMGFS